MNSSLKLIMRWEGLSYTVAELWLTQLMCEIVMQFNT